VNEATERRANDAIKSLPRPTIDELMVRIVAIIDDRNDESESTGSCWAIERELRANGILPPIE
jgi:hypothetical protein